MANYAKRDAERAKTRAMMREFEERRHRPPPDMRPRCEVCGAAETETEALWEVKSAGTVTGRYCDEHRPS